jgi:hypothetical protein
MDKERCRIAITALIRELGLEQELFIQADVPIEKIVAEQKTTDDGSPATDKQLITIAKVIKQRKMDFDIAKIKTKQEASAFLSSTIGDRFYVRKKG